MLFTHSYGHYLPHRVEGPQVFGLERVLLGPVRPAPIGAQDGLEVLEVLPVGQGVVLQTGYRHRVAPVKGAQEAVVGDDRAAEDAPAHVLAVALLDALADLLEAIAEGLEEEHVLHLVELDAVLLRQDLIAPALVVLAYPFVRRQLSK